MPAFVRVLANPSLNLTAYGGKLARTLASALTAGSLACQLLGVLRQRRHIVRVNPALPLHAACGKLAGLALGLALGCGFGGCHFQTSGKCCAGK